MLRNISVIRILRLLLAAQLNKGDTMDWGTIMMLLQLIWSSVSPTLKAAALAELKTLEVQYKDKPFILALVKEAEVIVSAALTAAAPQP